MFGWAAQARLVQKLDIRNNVQEPSGVVALAEYSILELAFAPDEERIAIAFGNHALKPDARYPKDFSSQLLVLRWNDYNAPQNSDQ